MSNQTFLPKETHFRMEANKLGIRPENDSASHYTQSSGPSSPLRPLPEADFTGRLTGKGRWDVLLKPGDFSLFATEHQTSGPTEKQLKVDSVRPMEKLSVSPAPPNSDPPPPRTGTHWWPWSRSVRPFLPPMSHMMMLLSDAPEKSSR